MPEVTVTVFVTVRNSGWLAHGERSPAVLCRSFNPDHDQGGLIVQIMGRPAGVNEGVNRRAESALRQPAHRSIQFGRAPGGRQFDPPPLLQASYSLLRMFHIVVASLASTPRRSPRR